MTISLVPVLVTQFVGTSQAPFYLGLIASLTGVFASFLRIFAGFLTDRFSRKKPLIALGYALSALFSTLVGFARSIGGIITYRILSFTGSGLREPPRDALIAATIEPKNYGRAFGLSRAMDTLGALVGPLVALACAKAFSIHTIFALSFIPGILAVFSILFLTADVPVQKKASKISLSFWKDFLFLPRSFIAFSVVLFLFHLGNFDKLLLLTRTQEILDAPKDEIVRLLVLLYALFNLVRAFSEFFIGLLSDYINRITLLAFFGCGVFAAASFLLITPHASLLYCSFIFALSGLSAATVLTLKKACAADLLPAEIRGLGYGVLQASEGIATFISNILIGFLWTRYSPFLGFSFAIITSLVAFAGFMGFRVVQRHI